MDETKDESFFNRAAKAVIGRNEISGWSPAQVVWIEDDNGAEHKLFLGDATSAQNLKFLKDNNITHIINCTKDLPYYQEGNPDFKFYR